MSEFNGILDGRDYFEIPHFIKASEIASLREQIRLLNQNNQFRSARIGSLKLLEKEVRSDEIFWIDESTLTSSGILQDYFYKLEALKSFLNQKYFLGLNSHESHFSIYQVGAFYQRHLDASSATSTRQVSLICYLNDQWQVSHGGQLRIYHDNQFTDIEPVAGKLVGFLSREVEHEVLPAYSERMSLTSWFLNRR